MDEGCLQELQTYGTMPAGCYNQPSQWYIYPDYFLQKVVSQPNSSPPFPAPSTNAALGTDAAGEEAAYDWFSFQILAPPPPLDTTWVSPTCIYEGTSYSGIRCEYYNLSSTPTLETCASTALSWEGSSFPPDNYEVNGIDVPISQADWAAVLPQLHAECQYAADVQGLYSSYNTIFTTVFMDNSSQLLNLATDAGVASTATISTVPQQLIEGIIYSVLSATGDVGAGLFANLMETATNTAAAMGNSALSTPLTDTVENLYTSLGTQLQVLNVATSNGENLILEDWGRLSQIGPRTEVTGYNGLGLTAGEEQSIEAKAEGGYALMFLNQLLPVNYGMSLSVGRNSTSPPYYNSPSNFAPPSYDQFNYLSFGSAAPSAWNVGSVYLLNWKDGNPGYPQQAAITDLQDNGADPFEYVNGINLWRNETLTYENIGCSSVVVTLYNASPQDLWIYATASEGVLSAPGTDFFYGDVTNQNPIGATQGAYELRPFGYATFFAMPNDDTHPSLSMTVSISETYEGPDLAAGFEVSNPGCSYGSISVSNASATNGYQLSGPNVIQPPKNVVEPGGVWAVVYNSSFQN